MFAAAEEAAEGHSCPTLTYFMIQFRQLNLHFLPLEEMIFSLFAHGRDHVKLPGYGVGFLERRNRETKYFITLRDRTQPQPSHALGFSSAFSRLCPGTGRSRAPTPPQNPPLP